MNLALILVIFIFNACISYSESLILVIFIFNACNSINLNSSSTAMGGIKEQDCLVQGKSDLDVPSIFLLCTCTLEILGRGNPCHPYTLCIMIIVL